MSTTEHIRTLLQQAFTPQHLEIRDDSAKHAGHAGARTHGGGHYAVTIVSKVFVGKSAVQRHRAVYAALQPMMLAHIHALQIVALTSEEWEFTPQESGR